MPNRRFLLSLMMLLLKRSATYRFGNRILYAAILALFFFIPVNGAAQGRKSGLDITPKKTTRIFYGQASFYANKFIGRKTASGEIFDQKKMTCACNVLPLGTWIKVTNLRNGRSVIVKVNDRLHPRMKRIVDLSGTAAKRLGYISSGLTRVKVEPLEKKQIPR